MLGYTKEPTKQRVDWQMNICGGVKLRRICISTISITDIAKLLNNEKTAINIIFRRLNKRIYDEMVIG